MLSSRQLVFGVLGVAVSASVFGAQGCVVAGDASLGNDGSGAGAGNPSAGAGNPSASAGMSHGGTKAGTAGSTSMTGNEGGAASDPVMGEAGMPSSAGMTGTGGDPSMGGAPSAVCDLPIETGPCDAAISSYAFNTEKGTCERFVYGGCEGNDNRFATLTACQAACENITCPLHLQTDTVHQVLPLNRPEKACIVYAESLVVSCSQLLNPTETVPTNYGQEHCVTRDGQLYYAQTTLPKANGWKDCSAGEVAIFDGAPDCADLK